MVRFFNRFSHQDGSLPHCKKSNCRPACSHISYIHEKFKLLFSENFSEISQPLLRKSVNVKGNELILTARHGRENFFFNKKK